MSRFNYVKNGIKGFVGWLLYLFSFDDASGAVILMYHSVGYDRAYLTVTPEKFEKQMKWLVNHDWKVLSIEEALNNKASLRKTAIITFDDAFVSVYEHAVPILKRLQLPATIFVPTDLVGKVMTDRKGITLPVMDWKEIEEVHKNKLFTIGSHTASHPSLPNLSAQEIERELADSKAVLKEHDIDAKFLAYPKGKTNEIVAGVAEKIYKAACSTIPDRYCENSNQYHLPRSEVNSFTNFGKFLYLLSR